MEQGSNLAVVSQIAPTLFGLAGASAAQEIAVLPRWYVVQTKPHQECIAQTHLERQGFRVFCPRIRRAIRHARRVKQTLAAFFPNYLFVRVDIAREQWRPINSTQGVVRLLQQADQPQPVPYGVVESLWSLCQESGYLSWNESLHVGQSVRVLEGPFLDIVGELEHLDGAGRVRVLLTMFGRSVAVALPREAISSAA